MAKDHKVEADVEGEAVDWAEDEGGEALKLVLYNEVGFLDRTLLLPNRTILFPELKHPNGRGRKRHRQEYWVRRLTELGFEAGFCNSLEEVQEMARRAGYVK